MSIDLAHLSSDEDTEEENNNNGASSPSKEAEGKALPKDELLRTKRPRSNKPFNEDLLLSDEGLSRIYREFPLACQFQARGSEAAYLQRVINFYKDWAFQLHPGLSFNDVVMKCESLGSKARIRANLMSMRDRERERYVEEVLLPRAREREANDIAMEISRSPEKKQKKRKRKSHKSTSPEEEELEEQNQHAGENSENETTNDKNEKERGVANAEDDPFGTDDDEPVESERVVVEEEEEVLKDENKHENADGNADQEEKQEDMKKNDKDDKESIFGEEEPLPAKTAEGEVEHVTADDADGIESFEDATQRQ